MQKKTLRHQGCQIDLLLRTKHAPYVVETKMKKHVGKPIVDEVKEKVARLRLLPTQSVRTGLIYEGDLDPEIARSDYFQFLIPAERLLALPVR